MTDSDFIRPLSYRSTLQENQSWQRNELGTSGRSYYDRRASQPTADRPRQLTSIDAGRALRVAGLALVSVGVAGWVWMILTFVSSVGAGTIPDHPFGARISDIPLGSVGLVAVVAGTLLATVGAWLARAAQNRRERARLGLDRVDWS